VPQNDCRKNWAKAIQSLILSGQDLGNSLGKRHFLPSFRRTGQRTAYDSGSSHLIMHAYRLIDNAENTGSNERGRHPNASRRRWSQRLHRRFCGQSLLSSSGQERRRYPAMA
jgi:hypothetical protein